jgi:hypothetical protein
LPPPYFLEVGLLSQSSSCIRVNPPYEIPEIVP